MHDKGEHNEAARQLGQVLALNQKLLGNSHPSTLGVASNLGYVLASLGHYSEARILLSETHSAQKQLLGESHPDTIKTMEHLWEGFFGADKRTSSAISRQCSMSCSALDEWLAIVFNRASLARSRRATKACPTSDEGRGRDLLPAWAEGRAEGSQWKPFNLFLCFSLSVVLLRIVIFASNDPIHEEITNLVEFLSHVVFWVLYLWLLWSFYRFADRVDQALRRVFCPCCF